MVCLRDYFRRCGIRYLSKSSFEPVNGVIAEKRVVLIGELERRMKTFSPVQRVFFEELWGLDRDRIRHDLAPAPSPSFKPYLIYVKTGEKTVFLNYREETVKTEPAFQFSKWGYEAYLKIISPPKPTEPNVFEQNLGAGERI